MDGTATVMLVAQDGLQLIDVAEDGFEHLILPILLPCAGITSPQTFYPGLRTHPANRASSLAGLLWALELGVGCTNQYNRCNSLTAMFRGS